VLIKRKMSEAGRHAGDENNSDRAPPALSPIGRLIFTEEEVDAGRRMGRNEKRSGWRGAWHSATATPPVVSNHKRFGPSGDGER